jgi:hypothetical protein
MRATRAWKRQEALSRCARLFLAHEDCGTVDWRMEFPDGTTGIVSLAQRRADLNNLES